MKSTVKRPETPAATEFPKLMLRNGNGLVVLMRANREGTVVHTGVSSFQVGDHSTNWPMGVFVDYDGVVTLEN